MKLSLILVGILLIVQLQAGIIEADYTPEDFEGGFFKFSDLTPNFYKVDIWKNQDDAETGNQMMAFGDFNGDTYTDFVTLRYEDDIGYVDIYKWDEDKYNFYKYSVCGDTNDCGAGMVNIYPVDINYDGLLDLLILFDEQQGDEYYRQLVPLLQDSEGKFKTNNKELQTYRMHKNSMPFLANIENVVGSEGVIERLTQIIFEEDTTQNRGVIQVTKGKDSDSDLTTTKQAFTNYISDTCANDVNQIYPFSSPNYNAVVDINGDCRSDLVFTTVRNGDTYIEIWTYEDDGKYCLNTLFSIEQTGYKIKGVSYADFNFNGSTDIIVLYEGNNGVMFKIYQNSQKIDNSNLCSKKDFDFKTTSDLTYNGYYLPKNTNKFVNNQVVYSQLRYGDVNQDGYNDLILVLRHGLNSQPIPYILLNTGKGDINFKIQNQGTDDYTFTNLFSPAGDYIFKSVAFFDLNENGILDMMVNYQDGEGSPIYMSAIYNYRQTQNYFLKTLGLNGQCKGSDDCKSALYYGATFMCKVTVNDNDQTAGKGTQLSQSSYSPLQLPFAIIGLGRTNNYIENLKAGYPQIGTDDYYATWQTIIPNSQLIIYPYGDNSNNWEISIFIQPTKAVIVVIIVTAIILICLGVSIIYCHIKEKEEDKKNQEPLSQIFR